VAYSLSDYLDIDREAAVRHWQIIRMRGQQARQEQFRPVEVLLCFALFRLVNPRQYGKSGVHRLPRSVLMLAKTVHRTPSSLLLKMQNLSYDMPNGAKVEPEIFLRLSLEPDRFLHLYRIVIEAARQAGLDADAVPDVLGLAGDAGASLLGQDEIGGKEIGIAVDAVRDAVKTSELRGWFGEQETERFLEQKVRLGQHRFAVAVLTAFDHRCGFCGWAPEGLRGRGLLLASHIKPWAVCETNDERLDPRNGIAACPMHDKAFDGGLLTVNGGLRIHRAKELEARLVDPLTETWFGTGVLRPRLLLGHGAEEPGKAYLDYHRQNVFERVG
jgi:putative restriction endonuclease